MPLALKLKKKEKKKTNNNPISLLIFGWQPSGRLVVLIQSCIMVGYIKHCGDSNGI